MKEERERGRKNTRTWAGDPVPVRVPIQEALVGQRLEVDGTLERREERKRAGEGWGRTGRRGQQGASRMVCTTSHKGRERLAK